jgi:hypothetical protein
MQRIDQFQFYQLGAALAELKNFRAGKVTYDDVIFPTLDAWHELGRLITEEVVPLVVARSATVKLRDQLHGITSLDLAKLVPPGRVSQTKGLLKEFEAIFSAELATLDA